MRHSGTLVAVYLFAIVLANLSIAIFGPAASIANAFLLIGLDLSTRDALHDAWAGLALWPRMAALIAAGSLLSWALGLLLGVGVRAGQIALASAVAFALASAVDAVVYHGLRRSAWLRRANGSNLAGAAVDSLAFPALAFGAWLPLVVMGQFAAKVIGGALWAWALSGRYRRAAAARP